LNRRRTRLFSDACGGLTPTSHDLALRRLEAGGATMTNWIQVLLEFQRNWTRKETALQHLHKSVVRSSQFLFNRSWLFNLTGSQSLVQRGGLRKVGSFHPFLCERDVRLSQFVTGRQHGMFDDCASAR
jgi:hypothetical protein